MTSIPQIEKMIVNKVGATSQCRCINKPSNYMILPRADRVEHHLPNFTGVDAQVLITPQQGAYFVGHELLVAPGGGTSRPRDEDFEQFLFVQEGRIQLSLENGKKRRMPCGGYCWLPPHCAYRFTNNGNKRPRVIWIRRRYEEVEGIAIPDPILAHESDVPANPVDTYMEKT